MKHLATDRINDYLDEELAPDAAASVRAHLDACAACRAQADALRRVIARVGALPRSVEPPRDLRPGIRGRAARPAVLRFPAVPRWAPALAAAAVLVIALGLGLWRGRTPDAPPGPTPDPSYAHVEQRYETVVAELAGLLAQRKERVPAAVRTEIDATLAEIDRTLDQSRRALRQAPGDVELELGLSATYAQKIELLHQALDLTTTTE